MAGPKNVEKIVIKPFLNQKQDKKADGGFTIPVNPETYNQQYKIETKNKPSGGNQGSAPEYKFSKPQDLKLEFILDNTGTIEGNILDGTPIPTQVKSLVDTVYTMQGESHRPSILKIQWGAFFTFDCILSTLDISYVLFKPDGEPLRAKVSATFTQYTEPEKRTRQEDKRSPDLTRVVQVQQDDNLPRLCYQYYGDTKYYLQVAWVNDLVSLRPLETGSSLQFPPIRTQTTTK